MPNDDLIIQGAKRRDWNGRMVLVKVGIHSYMKMPEDEARARGYTPLDPVTEMELGGENKMRPVSENKRRGRPRRDEAVGD